MSEPFVAEIRMFAGSFAPRGWAFCDGQLLPISQNTALFSLIGTTYGGDGRSTTALPNLRDRTPMHPGQGPGLTAKRLGQGGGVEKVTLSGDQIPGHTHTVRAANIPFGVQAPNEQRVLNQANINAYQSDTSENLANLADQSLATVGGSQPHNNLQPFLVMNFIIALVGLYPSRS